MYKIGRHSVARPFWPFWLFCCLFWLFCLLLLGLLSSHAYAVSKQPLPAQQVFQFSVQPTNTDSIIARWTIAPGYYLYRDRISFKLLRPKQASLGLINLPQGIEEVDDILGPHQVYEHNLTISIPILNPANDKLVILAGYQGCAEWGFCYPPIFKKIVLDNNKGAVPIATIKDTDGTGLGIVNNKIIETTTTSNGDKLVASVKPNATAPLSEQDKIQSLLAHSHAAIALLIFFGFGILLAFTPCVLPMIPILSSIIVGQVQNLNTQKAFGLSLAYVFSMSVTFAIAGLIVGLVGQNLQAAMQNPIVIASFSMLFVLLALSLFGLYELQLPSRLQQRMTKLSNQQKAGSYLGVATMGVLATLVVSPCVSAPLVGALAYIGNTGNVALGGAALFIMGIGMGLPLLIIGTSFGRWLPRAGRWMDVIKGFFAIVLLMTALWLLQRILPTAITILLQIALAIFTAAYIGALLRMPSKTWIYMIKTSGLIILSYVFFIGLSLLMGTSNLLDLQTLLLNPNAIPNTMTTTNAMNKVKFTRIKSIADVQQQLTLAKAAGKPVMLDFYADWCIACKEMERTTFSKANVKQALKHYVLLQADMTANDTIDKALIKHYGVIAPPTIIFFDKDGNELKNYRIVGEISTKQFLQHLQDIYRPPMKM